jgi:hypothetical protein
MSIESWNENKQMLWNVISDLLMEQNAKHIEDQIYSNFNEITDVYFNKRFEYPMDDLNRAMLSDINNVMTNIKNQNAQQSVSSMVTTLPNSGNNRHHRHPIQDQRNFNNNSNHQPLHPQSQNTRAYTHEQIRQQRVDIANERYEKAKSDFDAMSNRKVPGAIDFSDKEVKDEGKADIDALMAEEMESRKYDMQQASSVTIDREKISSWLSGETDEVPADNMQINSHMSNTNANLNNVPRLKIHEKESNKKALSQSHTPAMKPTYPSQPPPPPPQIPSDKKVTFQDEHETKTSEAKSSPTSVSSFLSKLKKKQTKQLEKNSSNTSLENNMERKRNYGAGETTMSMKKKVFEHLKNKHGDDKTDIDSDKKMFIEICQYYLDNDVTPPFDQINNMIVEFKVTNKLLTLE